MLAGVHHFVVGPGLDTQRAEQHARRGITRVGRWRDMCHPLALEVGHAFDGAVLVCDELQCVAGGAVAFLHRRERHEAP